MITAEVFLWNTRIGVVSIDGTSQFSVFRYDPEFLASKIEVSPLMMPLSNVIYQFNDLRFDSFKGLPGLLSDSLPDKFGNAIIDGWLEQNGKSKESFGFIERLCYTGNRGMGALEYKPHYNEEYNVSDEIEVSKLVELSNRILNHKEKVTAHDEDNLEDIVKVGTSAGGARAKAIIAYNEETGVVKSGQVNAGTGFTYWLLKLGGVNQESEETNFTRREYAYYLMAKEAKIEMTESRLLILDKQYHFMTKRFDRIVKKDGIVDKVHMQTLGALAHVSYKDKGAMSYEDVTHIMYDLGIKKKANEQFYRRMVFNVMAINRDDHVKNISFLMNRKGVWSLSPAYDITYAYNPNGEWTNQHQMRINGKVTDISKEDLLESAHMMKIDKEKALQIISDVKNALLKWNSFAKKAHLDEETINIIGNKLILHK